MGDDLAERLVAAGNDGLTGLPLLMLVVEAANELERLRADRDSWMEQAHDRINDWDDMRIRAEKAERELAALRERIEKAPVGSTPNTVTREPDYFDPMAYVVHVYMHTTEAVETSLCSKRVRLLVEDEP